MARVPNLNCKSLLALRQNPRVADIENGACDDERFFVHLHDAWTFTHDPYSVTRTRSFSRAADAVQAVRAAVAADTWLVQP